MQTKLSETSGGVVADQRSRLLAQVKLLERQALQAVENGNLVDAGRTILAALDCERRAGSVGPQVLQLIKPRA